MEPRKATDILLAIEAKIDQILGTVRTQDLNNKILSNKLNVLIAKLESINFEVDVIAPEQNLVKKPWVEAELSMPEPQLNITVENDPLGFRRTSRPETYATPQQLSQVSKPVVVQPTRIELPPSPTLPQPMVEEWKSVSMPVLPKTLAEEQSLSIGKVSVEQRIVDRNGKAVFLANVEIINKQTNKLEIKTRTNSTGKWQAVLPAGVYDIKVAKSESMSKEKIELRQEILVDNKAPTQQLPMVIAK